MRSLSSLPLTCVPGVSPPQSTSCQCVHAIRVGISIDSLPAISRRSCLEQTVYLLERHGEQLGVSGCVYTAGCEQLWEGARCQPCLSSVVLLHGREDTSGNTEGGVGIAWGSLPGPPASSHLVYLESVSQDRVLVYKTARDPPQKGPRLSWGKDRWDLWLSRAQAKLCSNCQRGETWTCGSGKLRCCHWD